MKSVPKLVALPLVIILASCGGSEESTTSISIDNQSNLTPISKPTFSTVPSVSTQQTYAIFEFSSENASAYECQLNDQQVYDCDGSETMILEQRGEHTFTVWALNEAGEHSEPESFTWTINSIFTNDEINSELIQTTVYPSPVEQNSWKGIFRINCDFSHSSYNDPIVYPEQENAAHLHRFYGNTLVDHMTTFESLYSQGESTCQGNTLNLSSYWVPALLAPSYDSETGERLFDSNGEPEWKVVPAVVGNDDEAHEIFYYSAGVDDLASIQPIPPGLRMIAGNHMGQPEAEQDNSIVRWHCQSWESNDASNPRFSASIPECEAPDRLRMDIFFPSCWNGVDLDSSDHKSHMAYPVHTGGASGLVCPSSHPVPIARPSYHYAFGVKPDVYDPIAKTSRGWRLASDMYDGELNSNGGMSLHADWFNGWHPEAMQTLLDNCIKGQLDCHDGNLANGYRLTGTREGSQYEPPIINKGMGY